VPPFVGQIWPVNLSELLPNFLPFLAQTIPYAVATGSFCKADAYHVVSKHIEAIDVTLSAGGKMWQS
jgi:hypothetical protein